jgi:hypothetical protein
MAYYTGDIPAEDLVIEPARNGEPVDLTPFDEAVATLYAPDGAEVESAGFLATIDDDHVIVEWPTESVLDTEGVYRLSIVLESNAGPTERLSPVYLVAQEENGWHTCDSAREEWRDAPTSDARLFQVLAQAREQVTEFAPALAAETPIPSRYREGQMMQARNLWNAGRVDPGSGATGDEDFVIRPFPLDWMVKQVLRPQRAIGAIG